MPHIFTDPSYHTAAIRLYSRVPVREIILGKVDPRSQPHVKAAATRAAADKARRDAMTETLKGAVRRVA